ncbi:helix-turn-helix domain-containing protein [Caproiciproducens faecalis]|uniref:Helix-turn-helix transcriptional regulator n=1 Tax=Caproiciproducens faecalis TaxID=2820301 RepID=A0ABS7DPP6_9FIRM|nr:helix-turn-helix transcriptional regulator [Caproiciproducens faecalis]MBW7573265.1 helix-turn-helix transcriptional regulator [Caproiciproducens faecalis]
MDKAKMEIMQRTAEQIKYLRKNAGFSQKSLADSAGLDPAFLGHIERCLKCPTIDTVNKIAVALNISLSELLNFEIPKKCERKEAAVKKIMMALESLTPQETEQLASVVIAIVAFKKRDSSS